MRFILKKTLLPHDLLLVRADELPKNYGGLYWDGVALIEEGDCLFHTIAHELGHAHQHAIAAREMGPNTTVFKWKDTQEGKAYAAAWAKDWKEVGKHKFDGGHFSTPIENMAGTANDFWNIGGKLDTECVGAVKLEKEAPNRFRWAQEWLSKK